MLENCLLHILHSVKWPIRISGRKEGCKRMTVHMGDGFVNVTFQPLLQENKEVF